MVKELWKPTVIGGRTHVYTVLSWISAGDLDMHPLWIRRTAAVRNMLRDPYRFQIHCLCFEVIDTCFFTMKNKALKTVKYYIEKN